MMLKTGRIWKHYLDNNMNETDNDKDKDNKSENNTGGVLYKYYDKVCDKKI